MPPRKRQRKGSPTKTSNKKQKTESSTGETPTYNFWLMKSEPESRIEKGIDVKFGIDDLKNCSDETDCWDGVRNYQARNFMKDMKLNQRAFFYHSNCKEPGIAGIIKIVKESYPDHTQFDKTDLHYDPGSDPKNPRWHMVDVKFERKLKRFISLKELKALHLKHSKTQGPLHKMFLFARSRLSVQPITDEEWDFILSLEDMEHT